MATQFWYPQYTIHAVALAAFVLGALLIWLIMRVRISAALERGKSESLVQLAQLQERINVRDRDNENLAKQATDWESRAGTFRSALDTVREERAKLAEQASTIPELKSRLSEFEKILTTAHADLMRISNSEAEKSQGLESATRRLMATEQVIKDLQANLDQLQKSSNQELERRVSLEEQNSRLPELEAKLGEAEETIKHMQAELSEYREKSGRLDTELKALQKRLEELKNAASTIETERDTLRNQCHSVTTELAESKTKLDSERSLTEEKIALLNDAKEQLSSHETKLGVAEETIKYMQAELSEYREKSGRLDTELKALQKRLEELKNAASTIETERDTLRNQCHSVTTELAESKTKLDSERSLTEEKIALLNDAKEQLSSQFKNLANEILEDKSRRFTEQNQTNIGAILDPLREKIKEFQTKVEDAYVKETKDRSALAEQVRQLMDLNQNLSQDAKSLTRALKGDKKTQGLWGELVLERVLESAGLRKGEEYQTQESHAREDGGRSQPDVVIRLPENRHLVVDAKVSLTAYERYTTADTDGECDIERKRHIESIRNHIKGLSEKNYQALYGLKQLDFVLMFVAVEPAFMLAVTEDRELFMGAWQKNVLLVSPSTLLFVLRTVAHLWRQEQQNKNAQEIAKRGAELYDKLTGFSADLERLGDRLNQARESYDGAVNKLAKGKGNVIRQAEMLKELGVKPSKSQSSRMLEFAQIENETQAAVA